MHDFIFCAPKQTSIFIALPKCFEGAWHLFTWLCEGGPVLKYVEKIRLMLLWLSCHFQRWGFVCQGMGRFGITHAFLFNTCGWLTLSALIPSQRCLKGKVIDLKIQRRLLIKQHSTWWYILTACALYFQTSWINLGECMPLTGVHKSNYPVVRMPDWPWLATHNLDTLLKPGLSVSSVEWGLLPESLTQ